jgi:hypothetical protein
MFGHDGRTRLDLQDGHRSMRRRDLAITMADNHVSSVGITTIIANRYRMRMAEISP